MRYEPAPIPTRTDAQREFLARELRRIAQALAYPFPFGKIYISSPAATTISVAGTYYKAAGTTAEGDMQLMTMPANNRLQYNGEVRRHFHVAVSVSMSTAGSNEMVGLKLAQNGVVDDSTTVRRKTGGASDVGSTAVHGDFMMVKGDYLELFVTNESSTNTVTINKMYFFGIGIQQTE